MREGRGLGSAEGGARGLGSGGELRRFDLEADLEADGVVRACGLSEKAKREGDEVVG